MASVSIVNLSEVRENGWRLDGEYWLPKYLNFERKAQELKYPKFKDLKITKFGSGENLPQSESGTQFVRTQNIRDVMLSENGISYTDAQKFDKLQDGDIIFTRVGMGIGDSSIVTKDWVGSAYSDNTICVRIRDERMNNYFLGTFFASNLARGYISRFFNGTAQPIVSKTTLGELYIPILSHTFQTKIEQTVKTAHALLENSKTAYKTAENLLLDEVFGSWKPATHKNWHVKMLSEVQSAGRMDAEYFHAKYEDLLAQIKGYKGGWCELGEVFSQNKTTKSIKENEIYKYVEIGSVDTSSGEVIPAKIEGGELPANAKIDLQINDVIVSTVRSYRGAVGIIQENGMIGSGAFTVLQEKADFKKEALFIILRTALYKDFSQKFATGMSYPVITDGDVLNFPLPLLPQPLQNQIATLVKQSFEDRTQSKALLQLAKTAVEKAIEEGEDVGLTEINSIKLICQPN